MSQIPEDITIQDGDSNEVCTAKYMLQVHWLLTKRPDLVTELADVTCKGVITASEVLSARGL